MMFFLKKIVIFIFLEKKRKFRFFRGKNPEFQEKDGNLFFISWMSGTPKCAQIYLKSLKASLKTALNGINILAYKTGSSPEGHMTSC
jgi:hypothetical protein